MLFLIYNTSKRNNQNFRRCFSRSTFHGPRWIYATNGHATHEPMCSSCPTASQQRSGERWGSNPRPAIHATVQPDLRVFDAMGQPERGRRHAGAVPFHHRVARISAGNEKAPGGELFFFNILKSLLK